MTNANLPTAAPLPESAHCPAALTLLPESANTSCPLCSGQEQAILSRYDGKSLRRCLNCGVAFVHPQPSPIDLAAHFENARQTGPDEMECKFETNREQVLARVADYIQLHRPPGHIVDVGCATGIFLDRFLADNPAWRGAGVELSPGLTGRAARRGLSIHLGNLRSANLTPGSVDVITVLDAFYYFANPQADLAEFRRVLTPAGLLVLELPWAGTRIWRTSARVGRLLGGARRPLLESSDHLFYYTPHSISLLLGACGFRVQTMVPLPGNRQAGRLRDLAYRAYSAFSRRLYFISGSRLFLGPRFLVLAESTCASEKS